MPSTHECPHETPCCPLPPGPPTRAMFTGDAESACKARNYVREVVEHVVPGIASDRVNDVQLVVSELVTNAIRYGTSPGDALLVVVAATAAAVRVEVHDPRRRRPRLRPESSERQRGRGLVIVDALAREWGVDDRPFGKVVWAELAW